MKSRGRKSQIFKSSRSFLKNGESFGGGGGAKGPADYTLGNMELEKVRVGGRNLESLCQSEWNLWSGEACSEFRKDRR